MISSPTWDAFADQHLRDSIEKVVVYNSLIDGGDVVDNFFETTSFPTSSTSDAAEFNLSNMNDRKLSVSLDPATDIYYISKSPMDVIQRDIRTTNGVIHMMNGVVAPASNSSKDYFLSVLNNWKSGGTVDKKNHLLLARVLQVCGLYDTLAVKRDEVYEMKYLRGEIPDLEGMTSVGFAEGTTAKVPQHRKIGFTIFVETDDYLASQNIDATSDDLFDQLKEWIQGNELIFFDPAKEHAVSWGTDYTNPYNYLNLWMTYHMLPMRIPADKLVIHDNERGYNPSESKKEEYTIPIYEYYTTMGVRRLLKIYESKESKGVYLNRFPKYNRERTKDADGHEKSCDVDKVGCLVIKNEADPEIMENCMIYPIDAPLAYNRHTRENLAKDRLRFDGMSLFPEAMTNDIRRNTQGKKNTDYRWVHIPPTSVYPYFENMTMSDETTFVYYNTYERWCNLQEDEMKAVGHYEIMVKLPPVPMQGIYELRYCVLANGNRGVVQPYFGHDLSNLPVTGIPMNLTISPNNGAVDQALMGWVSDDPDDEDKNAETDRQMRNNGFMKGSKSISTSDGGTDTERDDNHRENSRRILTRMTMYPDRTYYLKLKSVRQGERAEFYMDYLELCPKEIYDNPNEPEDIW